MAKRVHRYALVDLRGFGGGVNSPIELTRGHRIHRIEAGKQPAAGQYLALGVAQSPPAAQPLQQYGREHGVAILVALALLHAQHHAFAVDVAHLQRDHLAGAQSCAIRNRQGRLGLQVGRGGDQACDLVAAEHHGQGAWHPHRLHLGHQLSTTKGDVEEELQSGEGGVDRDRRSALINQVQLKTSQLLNAGGVG